MPDVSCKRSNSPVSGGIVLSFEEVSLEEVVKREAEEVRTRSYLWYAGTEIIKYEMAQGGRTVSCLSGSNLIASVLKVSLLKSSLWL